MLGYVRQCDAWFSSARRGTVWRGYVRLCDERAGLSAYVKKPALSFWTIQ